MSKLNQLRGGAAPAAVFSSDITKETTSVLERMQSGKSPKSEFKKFPEKKKFVPTRYWRKKGTSGSVIILDAQLTFAMREHSMKTGVGPKGNDIYEPERCIADWDSCPICNTDAPLYDVVLLSILDLEGYTTKDGKKVEYVKKVLPIKKADLGVFQALLEKKGSLRGMELEMTRGNGDKESAIGKPIFMGDIHSEAALLKRFGHEARVSDKGTVIVPENDAIQPWNYVKFWPVPTRNELTTKHGLNAMPGSREESEKEDLNLFEIDEEDHVQYMQVGSDLPEVE